MRTAAGRDHQSAVQLSTSSNGTGTYAAANYIALSANATAPADGDTALAAEIATAGGGLVRKQATYAHTPGATSSTLTATFTANGSDVLPVTLAKMAVFNAASAGTMPFESLITPTAQLASVADNITVTETVSM